MKEALELLDRRWIIKRKDPDLYFRVKDKLEELRSFFQEKCGYQIIANPLLIKLEKIPGRSESWMGIQAFEEERDYLFLILVLMFLEDQESEAQFILSQLTEFIENNYPKPEDLEWTVFSHRRSLIRVMRFCVEEGMILVTDGDESGFSQSESSREVLYENTGISRYFMRRFHFELGGAHSVRDLEEQEWQAQERDRGLVRRHRVYRKLILSPVIYQDGADDADYLYIKNQRGLIENDVEKYLDMDFYLHRNGSFLAPKEGVLIHDRFPDRSNITEIVLQLCGLIREEMIRQEWKRQDSDRVLLSGNNWYSMIEELRQRYSHGWSKQYRQQRTTRQLVEELNRVMTDYGMMEIHPMTGEVALLPMAGRMLGRYPEDYKPKQSLNEESETEEGEEDQNGTMEDQ